MALRSSSAGTVPFLSRSSGLGTVPRRAAPTPVTAAATAPAAERSAVLDVVTSVETVAHLNPADVSSGVHFAWEDTSNYVNNFTASGDQRPTLVTSWLDGNNGAQFD